MPSDHDPATFSSTCVIDELCLSHELLSAFFQLLNFCGFCQLAYYIYIYTFFHTHAHICSAIFVVFVIHASSSPVQVIYVSTFCEYGSGSFLENGCGRVGGSINHITFFVSPSLTHMHTNIWMLAHTHTCKDVHAHTWAYNHTSTHFVEINKLYLCTGVFCAESQFHRLFMWLALLLQTLNINDASVAVLNCR